MTVEYKAVIYAESVFSSIILGSAKVDPAKLSKFLTKQAEEGWRVKAMEREARRTLLFFKREAFLFILERSDEMP